jgi:hypothetical protein
MYSLQVSSAKIPILTGSHGKEGHHLLISSILFIFKYYRLTRIYENSFLKSESPVCSSLSFTQR